MKYIYTASIVAYKSPASDLSKAIDSILSSELNLRLYIVDNSPTPILQELCNDDRIKYIFNGRNIGFAKAHNIAIRISMRKSRYHLVMNPDVYFDRFVIERIIEFMDKNPEIGLTMPKVYYPDGRIQYLCKLLPTPLNLIFRKLFPLRSIFKKINDTYEMRFTSYNTIAEVPNLSGCFMFIRSKVFEDVGLFDEKFFMYLEDTDLSRRINEKYKTIYYPDISIKHKYEKGSYSSKRLLKYHIISAIIYFNKWGWSFDNYRKMINNQVMDKYR